MMDSVSLCNNGLSAVAVSLPFHLFSRIVYPFKIIAQDFLH